LFVLFASLGLYYDRQEGNAYMNDLHQNDLSQRITQLEELAWRLFRTLETYITFSELETRILQTAEGGRETKEGSH